MILFAGKNVTQRKSDNQVINQLIRLQIRKMKICITHRYQAHRFAIEPLTFLSTARMLALERESSFLLSGSARLKWLNCLVLFDE
jgi:hypothetical protein